MFLKWNFTGFQGTVDILPGTAFPEFFDTTFSLKPTRKQFINFDAKNDLFIPLTFCIGFAAGWAGFLTFLAMQ